MLTTWVYTIGSVIFVSLLSLAGVFSLALNQKTVLRLVNFMVAFAIGALLGDAFIHLIPHAFEHLPQPAASLYVLLGIFIFFILENFLRWRHCHHATEEHHPHPVTTLNLIGDGAHNFMDGLIIGASYLVSIPVGIATTIAVVLHEIPQELGDFGILIQGGFTVSRAIFFNFLSSLLAILGAVLVLLVGHNLDGFSLILLPITAGGFIYIAGSDLMPNLHHTCEVKSHTSIVQFLFILLGVAVMLGLLFLE